MEWASKGSSAMAAADSAEEAVYCYTKALIEHPHSPDYFAKRAAAFTRLKPQRHDLALRDAEYSILLGQKRAKREKIQAGQQRRVVALYGLGQYEDAKYLLGTMKKWRKTGDAGRSDQMEHDMWMAKLNTRLKDKPESKHTVTEYPEIDLPSEKDMKLLLQGQITDDGKMRYDAFDPIKPGLSGDGKSATHEQPTGNGVAKPATPAPKVTLQPIRNDFFQNNDNLIVTFYAKKVEQSKLVCAIEPDSVSLSFPHPEDHSSRFTYLVSPTFAKLDPGRSASKVFGTKVELTLAKAEKGIKWPGLQADVSVVSASLPNPYSSKTNVDWDKTVAEIVKKKPQSKGKDKDADDKGGDSDADSEYGGDAVDGFFKKLYAGADADTRKAMMKSFQESNGTALSTNWADVSKGHVDEVKSKDDQ